MQTVVVRSELFATYLLNTAIEVGPTEAIAERHAQLSIPGILVNVVESTHILQPPAHISTAMRQDG